METARYFLIGRSVDQANLSVLANRQLYVSFVSHVHYDMSDGGAELIVVIGM